MFSSTSAPSSERLWTASTRARRSASKFKRCAAETRRLTSMLEIGNLYHGKAASSAVSLLKVLRDVRRARETMPRRRFRPGLPKRKPARLRAAKLFSTWSSTDDELWKAPTA
jgi:hypothetical protein